jgi:hypothetical protein
VRRRFAYWIDRNELGALEEALRGERGVRLTPVKSIPCRGFHELMDVSYVAPGEWDKVCRRQGGWYRGSSRCGQYLALAPYPLDQLSHRVEALIEPSEFRPPRLPDVEEVAALARTAAGDTPDGWDDPDERERAYWDRLLARTGSGLRLEDVLAFHTANHMNFVAPRFYTESEESPRPIPYSIGDTAHVCSACVELFGILGAGFPVRYVVPCPGFVAYCGAPADAYLRVSRPGVE